MGQSASAYDGNYSDEEGDGSYYSSDEYSDEEEGYESESSSVMSGKQAGAAAGGNATVVAQDASGGGVDEQHHAVAAVEPANLEELSAAELKDLVDGVEISREDLIAASRAIRRGHLPTPPSPAAAAATEPSTAATAGATSQGFYADDGHYATDVKVAMRILSASDHVRHLRFRLVPARLKEPIFWSSLLGILRYGKGWVLVAEEERLAEHNQKRQQQEPPEQDSSGTNADVAANETESLRRHIRQRDVEVAQLRRALEASRAKIRSLEKEVANKAAEATKQTTTSAPAAPASASSASPLPTASAHKGEWIMDRDSQDFLALDEELKANLRGEKAKRLRDVREQMRFILDTDDVACSNGEWSCCKKKEYGCEGCAC